MFSISAIKSSLAQLAIEIETRTKKLPADFVSDKVVEIVKVCIQTNLFLFLSHLVDSVCSNMHCYKRKPVAYGNK